VLIIAALLLIGSFFLPNAVAGITDARRLNNLVMIDSQSISFDSVPELGIPDRIALVANSNTEILALKTGNVMDTEAAGERAARELTRFLRGGPFEFDNRSLSVEDSTALFIIDSANPTLNIVVWELVLVDQFDNTVTVTLDDETGLIIKMIFRRGRVSLNQGWTNSSPSMLPNLSEAESHDVAMQLSEMMAEYYGLPITLGAYEYSGSLSYYRADIQSNDQAIPMYGVVRAMSFTMNERVPV